MLIQAPHRYAGKYSGGDFSWGSSAFWITLVSNVSISFALYYLLAFYQASKYSPELAKSKPLCKFLSIKVWILLVTACWSLCWSHEVDTIFWTLCSLSAGRCVFLLLADMCYLISPMVRRHKW